MAKPKEASKKTNNMPSGGNAPKFRLNMLYVKDISFENPLSPGDFVDGRGTQQRVLWSWDWSMLVPREEIGCPDENPCDR